MTEVLAALLPPAVTCLLFVIVLRAILGADRRERKARARMEAEIAERAAATRAEESTDRS
jgi:Mg2+/citrate symporter